MPANQNSAVRPLIGDWWKKIKFIYLLNHTIIFHTGSGRGGRNFGLWFLWGPCHHFHLLGCHLHVVGLLGGWWGVSCFQTGFQLILRRCLCRCLRLKQRPQVPDGHRAALQAPDGLTADQSGLGFGLAFIVTSHHRFHMRFFSLQRGLRCLTVRDTRSSLLPVVSTLATFAGYFIWKQLQIPFWALPPP